VGHRVGPQREVILELRLDRSWNPDAPEIVRLRFGGIDNIVEVGEFFDRMGALLTPIRVEHGSLNWNTPDH